MRLRVTMKTHDLLSNEKNILFDGIGLLTRDTLKYKEEGSQAVQTITFAQEQVVLERKADVSSVTILEMEKPGTSVVKSQYGDMYLTTKLIRRIMKDDYWLVEYQVLSGEDVVLHQELVWEMRGLSA